MERTFLVVTPEISVADNELQSIIIRHEPLFGKRFDSIARRYRVI